jgi:hypothetical protein
MFCFLSELDVVSCKNEITHVAFVCWHEKNILQIGCWHEKNVLQNLLISTPGSTA